MKNRLESRSTLTTSEVMATLLTQLKPGFFDGLSPAQVASIVGVASERRFPAHSVLAREGDPASHIFLIIGGRARSL